METNRPGDNFRSREHALFLILNRGNAYRQGSCARNYSLRSTFHADATILGNEQRIHPSLDSCR